MLTNLILLKNTLNQIETHGEDNLRKILGCIELLTKMIESEGKRDDDSSE
jgi:hypothetical protein